MPRKIAAPARKLSLPKDWALADVYALQALQRGDASNDLQKRALDFIVMTLAGTYGDTFDDASARLSDFNQGKRKVGQLIVHALKLNLTHFGGSDENG